MENKKNNALEKAESAEINSATKQKDSPRSKEERENRKIGEKQNLEQARIEQEKINAEKRVELARLKAHEKEEKERRKATLKRDKQRRKAEMKEMREKNRQKSKQNKGYGGWLAAVITLGIATLILASVLTFTFIMPSTEAKALEVTYRKSFYDTADQVDNMDLNLSKAITTSDKAAMQGYLLDLAVNSELAENDINQLPLQDESKFYTTKLINQIGDFAKYLNKKLANGESLSYEDEQNLLALYRANRTLKEYFQTMANEMDNDFNFSEMSNETKGNLVIDNLTELENLSNQYPELIYDGPFSDGLDNRELKGLTGNEITSAEALSIFNKIFGGMGLTDIKNDGETSGQIECYNVSATYEEDMIYAQISKIGGKVIMFEYAGECNAVNYQAEYAQKTAIEFLESLGVTDMKPVWSNLANNVYTINLAYAINDIPVYSDLIKVRVCADTGKVLGMEAITYYTNHTERTIEKPVLSEMEAQEKVSSNIQIETGRLAIVPVGNSAEKLCYEFMGEYDGSTYYVYIDAVTGHQVEMFKVIQSTEGTLLM